MAGDTMKIALYHDGSTLGTRILDNWRARHHQTSELELVHGDSPDCMGESRPDLALLAADSPCEFYRATLSKCRELEIGILVVLGRGSTVLVGPLETPGVPGCVTCLQLRFENTFEHSMLNAILDREDGEEESLEMSPADLVTLGDIVADELQSLFSASPGSVRCNGRVGVYEQGEGIEWVPVVPSHDCPRCNLVPEDNPTRAEFELESHIVRDVDAIRVDNVDFKRLEELYVHSKVGYVSATNQISTGNPFLQANAYIYTPAGHDIVGYGSGMSVSEAMQSAVLEVLERSCGFQAVNRRPVVFGKYSDLTHAIHPSQFGFHKYEQLGRFQQFLEPFDEEQKYSFVWAYSTRNQKPVLIPEQIAYYGPTADKSRFVAETSNGCALGGTLEDAILHGVFEVLERDGFLNMWYGKMPAPEIRWDGHGATNIDTTLDPIARLGFDVRLFDISHDLSIPIVCAVAVRRKNEYPRVVSGTACHLNPYQAVKSALRELTVQVVNLVQAPEEKYQEAVSMFLDPTKVENILHHVAVGSLPEASPRWAFLLKRDHQPHILSVEEAYADAGERYQTDSLDIRLILDAVLDDLHHRGFDVIVVKQTSPEVAFGGLHAVKVLIPGMTPITFGYGHERVRGLKRLFELPYQMGFAPQVLSEGDLNKDLHPLS